MSPSARLQADQPSTTGAGSDPSSSVPVSPPSSSGVSAPIPTSASTGPAASSAVDESSEPAEDVAASQSTSRKATSRASRATRGRARGGRGRGRGGRQTIATTRSNGVGQARKGRGRIKQFDDAKVQAAYERSRELKDHWSALVSAVRPVVADLIQRGVDKLMNEPHSHEMTPEYREVKEGLDAHYAKAIEMANVEFHSRTAVLEQAMEHQRYVLDEQYKNAVEDLEEVFIDAQLNRLRILEALHDHGLPVDTQDIEHVFKSISAEEHKDFFPFVDYDEDNHVVPYPSRVPGTFMYQKSQDFQRQYKAEKAAATQAAQEARLQARAQAQLEEAESSKRKGYQGNSSGSGTKRSARNSTRSGGRHNTAAATNNVTTKSSAAGPNDEGADNEDEPAAARHPMGILGGVEEGAVVSASPAPDQEPEVDDDEDVAATTNSELPVRERSPPAPNGMQTPDEYGAAIVISRGKGHNRIMLRPPPYRVDDIEIGFKDSTNDPTRGSNVVANRGKYAGTPHSGSIHIDPMVWNYDARANKDGDLDEDLVEKFKVHPTYGFFLHSSRNEEPGPEDRRDVVDRGRPVVYLPPSGEIVSACRSTAAFVAEKVDDARKGVEVFAALKAFCDAEGITEDDIAPDADEAVPSELTGSSLRYPSLRGDRVAMRNFLAKHAIRAQEASSARLDEETGDAAEAAANEGGQADYQLPEEQQNVEAAHQFLHPLVQATIVAAAEGLAEDASEQRSSYDAIRDVFRPSAPEPPRPRDAGMALLTLAAACDTAPRFFESAGSSSVPPASAPASAMQQHQFAPPQQVHSQPMMGYDAAPGPSSFGAPPIGPSGPYDQAAPMGIPHGAPVADYYQQQQPPMGQYGQMGTQGYQQPPMLGPQSSPLPPLRPALQGEASPRPEEQPVSGGYYPPSSAVAHSGYHYPAPSMEHMGSQQGQHSSQMPMGNLTQTGPGYFPGQSPSYGNPNPYDPMMGQQMVATPPSRDRSGSTATLPPQPPSSGTGATNSAAKYRKLEPAPVPKHRRGWTAEPQLRTVGYDPSNDIKDYAANEPLPGRAPPYIRAWSHNSTGNASSLREPSGADSGPEKEDQGAEETPVRESIEIPATNNNEPEERVKCLTDLQAIEEESLDSDYMSGGSESSSDDEVGFTVPARAVIHSGGVKINLTYRKKLRRLMTKEQKRAFQLDERDSDEFTESWVEEVVQFTKDTTPPPPETVAPVVCWESPPVKPRSPIRTRARSASAKTIGASVLTRAASVSAASGREAPKLDRTACGTRARRGLTAAALARSLASSVLGVASSSVAPPASHSMTTRSRSRSQSVATRESTAVATAVATATATASRQAVRSRKRPVSVILEEDESAPAAQEEPVSSSRPIKRARRAPAPAPRAPVSIPSFPASAMPSMRTHASTRSHAQRISANGTGASVPIAESTAALPAVSPAGTAEDSQTVADADDVEMEDADAMPPRSVSPSGPAKTEETPAVGLRRSTRARATPARYRV